MLFGKKKNSPPAATPAPELTRSLDEIEAEISKLTKRDRDEAERRREIDEKVEALKAERERKIREAEESERQAQVAELTETFERHKQKWLAQISAVDDAMRGVMRQFAETVREGSAAVRCRGQIERLGGKVPLLNGVKSHFLDYFTYQRLTRLWREIVPNAPHVEAGGRLAELQDIARSRSAASSRNQPSSNGETAPTSDDESEDLVEMARTMGQPVAGMETARS